MRETLLGHAIGQRAVLRGVSMGGLSHGGRVLLLLALLGGLLFSLL